MMLGRLRVFHARCVRSMCRVSRKHTWLHRISTGELEQRLGLDTIDTYLKRRQLRWLGHVARMDHAQQLPRRMLSSWVPHPRPHGAPPMTYGRSIDKALLEFNIDRRSWPALAADRAAWRETLPPPGLHRAAAAVSPRAHAAVTLRGHQDQPRHRRVVARAACPSLGTCCMRSIWFGAWFGDLDAGLSSVFLERGTFSFHVCTFVYAL